MTFTSNFRIGIYNGYLVLTHKGGVFVDFDKKYKNKSLWGITAPVSKYMWFSILISVLSGILLILSLLFLAYWLGNYIEHGKVDLIALDMGLGTFVIYLAIVSALAFVFRFLSFYISHLGAFKLEKILRNDLSKHLSELPLGFITSRGSGDLKKVILDDVRDLHAFVADSVPTFGKAYFTPILVLIILFILDYRMALGTVFVLIMGGVLMSKAMSGSGEIRDNYDKAQANVNKSLIEFVQAMPIVRIFDDGTSSFMKYENAVDNYTEFASKWAESSRIPALFSMIVLGTLPTLIVNIAIGSLLLFNSQIGMFNFIASIFLCNFVSDTLMAIMWLSMFIRRAGKSANTIHAIFSEKSLEKATNPKIPTAYDIEFSDVSFAYKDREVLTDINFMAKQGTINALVGPSGAGKTTIAKLIARFWDVSSGTIKIGGVDIKDIALDELMNIVSFVFQENYLFNDTILNNILLANDGKSKEDAIAAAKAAQIHETIIALENGYDTVVSDRGTSLSGGERQRVTIARAILRDNPVIVLDEATAFADTENESKILMALGNLVKEKTVIIIAHKLQTIKNADQIIALNSGRIAELGTHDELVKNDSVYKTLWNNYVEASNWNIEKGSFANLGAEGGRA